MKPITGKATPMTTRIDSDLMDIEIFAKRAKVVVDDLMDEYFGFETVFEEKAYMITGCNYETAALKMGIINDYIYELLEELKELRSYVIEEDARR